MSYIPNIRERYERNIMTGEVKLDTSGIPDTNTYWEGYLNEEDSRVLIGYDNAMHEIDNLLSYNTEHFDDYAKFLGIEEGMLTDNEAAFVFDDDVDVLTMTEEDMAKYSKKAIFMKAIKQATLQWLEMTRNEDGVLMINAMEQEEYEKRVREVNEDGDKNALLRIQDL